MSVIKFPSDINKNNLLSAESVLGIGLVMTKELMEHRIATVFLNELDQVEICPNGEMELDSHEQEYAIHALLNKGYNDEQLLAYLTGRKARQVINE